MLCTTVIIGLYNILLLYYNYINYKYKTCTSHIIVCMSVYSEPSHVHINLYAI